MSNRIPGFDEGEEVDRVSFCLQTGKWAGMKGVSVAGNLGMTLGRDSYQNHIKEER